jgi:hypothetical protein
MDIFTRLFWSSFLLFAGLSLYLFYSTKLTPVFYAQMSAGFAMFITSKIGRTFLGLEWFMGKLFKQRPLEKRIYFVQELRGVAVKSRQTSDRQAARLRPNHGVKWT